MSPAPDLPRDPLSALRDGDPTVFETFVETQSSSLVGFYRRLGAAPEEAEDLVQELFMRLFRGAATYRPRERFEAYCYRIARNAWIDRRRRSALRPVALSQVTPEDEHESRSAADPAPAAMEQLAVREEAERLRAELAKLPEAQRLVFELGVVQELPYIEIASILGVPVGTVKSRMFHAVRKLREELGQDQAQGPTDVPTGSPSASAKESASPSPPSSLPLGGGRGAHSQ